MKYLTTALALFAAMTFSAAATLAQHDHIELELEAATLEIHGPGVLHNHEHYEFVKPGSFWQTAHDSNNWPGISGNIGTAHAGKTFDLIVNDSLYYWDGSSPAGFMSVTDSTYLQVQDQPLISSINITGTPTSETLAQAASVPSNGEVHTHPVWRLFGDGGDPADGSYLILFHIDPSDPTWSNTDEHALLFHKGLTFEQYESAADQAGAQFNLTVPEPGMAGVMLVALTGAAMRRRRRRA